MHTCLSMQFCSPTTPGAANRPFLCAQRLEMAGHLHFREHQARRPGTPSWRGSPGGLPLAVPPLPLPPPRWGHWGSRVSHRVCSPSDVRIARALEGTAHRAGGRLWRGAAASAGPGGGAAQPHFTGGLEGPPRLPKSSKHYGVSVAESQDCLKAGLQTRRGRVRSPGFSRSLAGAQRQRMPSPCVRDRVGILWQKGENRASGGLRQRMPSCVRGSWHSLAEGRGSAIRRAAPKNATCL